MDVGGVGVPIHNQAVPVQEQARLVADDPAPIALAFPADLLWAAPLSHRGQKLNARAVTNSKQRGRLQKPSASDIFGELVREDDLIEPNLRFENGAALVPDGPGLGVELDRTALLRYQSGPVLVF